MQIMVFSDIHNDWKQLEVVLKQKDVDLFLCAGDWSSYRSGVNEGIQQMSSTQLPVWVLPGNNETQLDIDFAVQNKLTSFHEKVLNFDGLKIGGIGFSPPTPFNTPGEKPESYFEKILRNFPDDLDIFVSHSPPKNTSLDKTRSGFHVGSVSIKEFILEKQPKFSFHGHIHECSGSIEKLGKTLCRSIGRKGYIFKLNNS